MATSTWTLSVLTVMTLLLVGANAKKNVIGGTAAESGKFPQIVSVQKSKTHFCGGTIIDPKWIVTAAHCWVNDDGTPVPASTLTVLAGATDASSPGRGSARRDVKALLVHEGYTKATNGNDIALLKLTKPLPLSSRIQVARLPKEDPRDGDTVTVAGWGMYDNAKYGENSDTLQYADLSALGRSKCKQYYGYLPEDQICAKHSGSAARGSCMGDSGGPLFTATKDLAGIVSWVGLTDDDECGVYPASFTSVPAQTEWIKKKTGLKKL